MGPVAALESVTYTINDNLLVSLVIIGKLIDNFVNVIEVGNFAAFESKRLASVMTNIEIH